MGLLEGKSPDELRQAVGIVGHPPRRRRAGRCAATWRVPRHHGVLVRELELAAPDPVVAKEAVKEHNRRPLAYPLIGNPEAIDVDPLDRYLTTRVPPADEARQGRRAPSGMPAQQDQRLAAL